MVRPHTWSHAQRVAKNRRPLTEAGTKSSTTKTRASQTVPAVGSHTRTSGFLRTDGFRAAEFSCHPAIQNGRLSLGAKFMNGGRMSDNISGLCCGTSCVDSDEPPSARL